MKNSKQKKNPIQEDHLDDATKKADQKKKKDDKLNRELKESFPASDTPSCIQPGSGAHPD